MMGLFSSFDKNKAKSHAKVALNRIRLNLAVCLLPRVRLNCDDAYASLTKNKKAQVIEKTKKELLLIMQSKKIEQV
jgi:hypothetical protein